MEILHTTIEFTHEKLISIRLKKSLLHDLDNYANELNQTRTQLTEKSITAYFDTLDEMVSDKIIDDIKNGETEVFSLNQIAKNRD